MSECRWLGSEKYLGAFKETFVDLSVEACEDVWSPGNARKCTQSILKQCFNTPYSSTEAGRKGKEHCDPTSCTIILDNTKALG